MGWQTVDWFILLIVVFFVGAIGLGLYRRRGRGGRRGAGSQRPAGAEKENERPGPTINM